MHRDTSAYKNFRHYAHRYYVFWYNIGMEFIDRIEEMERLARLVRERKGGFAAVWGGTKALLGEAKWSDKPFSDKEIEIMAERIKHRNPLAGISGKFCFALFLASVENRGSLARGCNDVEIVTADEVMAADL